MSDSLRPREPQHARPPCPSPTPGVYPNPCPLSRWCHPTISSSVIRFSSCPQSFPASGSFQMSQLFVSCGQNIGVSASTPVIPMNTWDWSPLGWTGRSRQTKWINKCPRPPPQIPSPAKDKDLRVGDSVGDPLWEVIFFSWYDYYTDLN